MIDVSELTFDPDFCQPFTVLRRLETVGDDGIAVITATPMDAYGSIQSKDTAIGGNTLEMGEDAQYRGAAIDVYTAFPLRSVSQEAGQNYQPDFVVWKGDQYKVMLINDYTDYGAGFVHAECTSIPSIDNAPT